MSGGGGGGGGGPASRPASLPASGIAGGGVALAGVNVSPPAPSGPAMHLNFKHTSSAAHSSVLLQRSPMRPPASHAARRPAASASATRTIRFPMGRHDGNTSRAAPAISCAPASRARSTRHAVQAAIASRPGLLSSPKMERVQIDHVELALCHPDELPLEWVGRDELRDQLVAAWSVVASDDVPLTPRLVGKPGVGKTTLAYAAGRHLGRDVYLFQATVDTRPEDLIVTPVVADRGRIAYVASPVVTAMIRGGVLVLDEGNRMSEKSWASLAPLLDRRGYVESLVAGVKVRAHPDFRFVATMNDDASTFDLPEYIHSRLQPQIVVDFPDAEEERLVLRSNLPFADEDVLGHVVAFLQRAHAADEPFTVRDGINVARYAIKLRRFGAGTVPWLQVLRQATRQVLGPDAAAYLEPSP